MVFLKEMRYRLSMTALLLMIIVAGCKSSPDLIQIDIGKKNPERLLAFYFGGYAEGEPMNPFSSGLLVRQESGYWLDLKRLGARVGADAVLPGDENGNDKLDWEEVDTFLQNTYYQIRPAPQTLAELRQQSRYLADTTNWMRVDVNGVMTTAQRHIYMPEQAVQSALVQYKEQGNALRYPVGTTVVAEHHEDGKHVETTGMRKRADGFWDYFVYDDAGNLAPQTTTRPRELTVPTRCVGCHFGEKQFEPEASFPEQASPGPLGFRGIHVGEEARDVKVVRYFDEHRKRSDTLLGLYGTLYVTELKNTKMALTEKESEIIMALDIERW